MLRTVLLGACAWTAANVVFAAQPVTFDDIMSMRAVAAATISPDGNAVLYTVQQWEDGTGEPGKKERRSQIWLVPAAGGTARQLTFGDTGASTPGWSPDGRYISFLASRGPTPAERRAQIWIMRAEGGEAVKITDSKEAVSSYAWSPDSTRIAYVAREAESTEAEARRKRGDDPRVYESDFRLSRLSVVDVTSHEVSALAPDAAFTIRSQPSWSPDGTRLTFAAAPTTMLRDHRDDVYIVTLNDRKIERITTDLGPDSSPRWSPDGRTIAFVSQPNPNPPGGDGVPHVTVAPGLLTLYDVGSKQAKDVSRGFDLDAADVTWSPDSRRLYFTTGKGMYREAFCFEPASARYTQLTTNRIISLGTFSRDGRRVAFVSESATQPAEVFVADASFTTPHRLTTINPQAADFALGESEIVRWKSDSFDIEGVLLKPVGFRPGVRYPLLVVIHGGPTGAFYNSFRVGYGDGGQHWAGQGWAVLYPNPRGSTNYGRTFMSVNVGDWGGGDYRDIMAGVDALVARGVADPDRLAVQGWSFGGFMTAWTVTQTTRFKAAMVGAGITSNLSMYGTNDLPDLFATHFKGEPSEETLPLYHARSAVLHAGRVTTPVLILHGESDVRVPIGQPMEFYRALKERGKIAELVFYPREPHGFTEYYHQLDRLTRQYDWITKYTLGEDRRKTTTQ
jgi:dipeptidyl aminopeptidase/acylaminoacyl peptidase